MHFSFKTDDQGLWVATNCFLLLHLLLTYLPPSMLPTDISLDSHPLSSLGLANTFFKLRLWWWRLAIHFVAQAGEHAVSEKESNLRRPVDRLSATVAEIFDDGQELRETDEMAGIDRD